MEPILLLGSGGHAKSIVDCIERAGIYRIVGFLDTYEKANFQYKQYKVIGDDNMLEKLYDDGIKNAFVCIGYLGKGDIRQKLYSSLKRIGFNLPNIIDPSAIIANDVRIGEGNFLAKSVIINADVNIGNMCIINTAAVIGHECIVDDFVHVSSQTSISGRSHIGRASFIGTGAIVIQCKSIGENAIVSAGSVVFRDVKQNSTVMGNPARKVQI